MLTQNKVNSANSVSLWLSNGGYYKSAPQHHDLALILYENCMKGQCSWVGITLRELSHVFVTGSALNYFL